MTFRVYTSAIAGDGTDVNPFRPVVSHVQGIRWMDGRQLPWTNEGFFLVYGDIDDAVHDQILVTPGITYFELHDLENKPVPPKGKIADIAQEKRDKASAIMESLKVPTNLVLPEDTLIEGAFKNIQKRLLLTQLLMDQDITEDMDSNLGALPESRKTSLRDRLSQLGFDVSVIADADLLRVVIEKLVKQNIRAIRV